MAKEKEEILEQWNNGSMEDFVLKLIDIKKEEKTKIDVNDSTQQISFHRLCGQIDVLYIVLTGWNNPQSNPK